ncbi:MAG: hypothetical protein QG596_635 [Actinomycetota bacterium]|jgi:hypothetical protein|nr:hypothetical protein [Actinomycetota bacterium]
MFSFKQAVATPAALIAAAIFGMTLAGSATALAPPPAPSGIAFSFGDQVVLIAADGSDRREFTRTGPFPEGDSEGRTGDSNPQLSPDGAHLLLTRFTPARDYGVRRRIVLAGADGNGARPILRGNGKVSFSYPAWMPDGESVAVARSIDRRGGTARSVVIASLDGKSVKAVFKLPLHRRGSLKQDLSTYREPVDIGVSPDGTRLLITLSNGYRYDQKWLVLLDLKSGKRRLVGRNTRHGSFSPDGNRFAYVSSAGNRGMTCTETDETSCVVQGDLYVQNVEGDVRQRLTWSRASEENPDWSPDGQRIAFDANYNIPKSGAAAEIYAIAPDGSCLSWLTNGAPAGVEPDWAPAAGPSDLTCGIEPKKPAIVRDWIPSDVDGVAISVWAGPRLGDRLVSSASLTGPFRYTAYDDCAVFDAMACAPPPKYEVGGLSTCFAGMYLGLVVGEAKRSAFGQRRGVTFLRQGGHGRGGSGIRNVTVFSGDTMLSISGDRKTGFPELIAQIDGLRPVNAAEPKGRLPKLYLPKGMPNAVKTVSRMVRRIGIKRTSTRLDSKPKAIRALVTFSKRMKLLGPIRTKSCTKEEEDPFAGF